MAKEASNDQISNIVFECRNHEREESRTSRAVRQEENIACVQETKWKGPKAR